MLACAFVIGMVLAAWALLQPKTLLIGVAPQGGTEPNLIRAYAAALATEKKGVRLEIVPFPGLRESAEALEAGRVDLAIVRPDLAMPKNGLTLAILRELAALVVAPTSAGIKDAAGLSGKRLAVLSDRPTDLALYRALIDHLGLEIRDDPGRGRLPARTIALISLPEDGLAPALRENRIDAVMLLTTPATPSAQRIVRLVRDAAKDREAVILGIPDPAALIVTMPRLQSVTVAAGLFGGNPRLPAEDLTTIGASHRLMARSTLSRSGAAEITQQLFEMRTRLAATVPSAEHLVRPAYDTTADATSARMPVHPGAIDYFEREQESVLERYESWIYLLAICGGGIGSLMAWARRSVGRTRRERIEIAVARLLTIRSEAARTSDLAALTKMANAVDTTASSVARHSLRQSVEQSTLEAAALAVNAARSTVQRAIERARQPVSDQDATAGSSGSLTAQLPEGDRHGQVIEGG